MLGWENLQELLDHGLAVVKDPVVWTTICCLLYLEEKCQPEKESWELVAQKATKWLKSRGVDEKTAREKAKQLMRKVSGKIVCPESSGSVTQAASLPGDLTEALSHGAVGKTGESGPGDSVTLISTPSV